MKSVNLAPSLRVASPQGLTIRRPAESAPPHFRLTETQRKVLIGLTMDFTMKEMAAEMGVSIHTVHTHLRAIYKRLGVRGSNAAIARSMRAGLI